MAKEVWLSAKNIADLLSISESLFMAHVRNGVPIEGVTLPKTTQHNRFTYSDVLRFVADVEAARLAAKK